MDLLIEKIIKFRMMLSVEYLLLAMKGALGERRLLHILENKFKR